MKATLRMNNPNRHAVIRHFPRWCLLATALALGCSSREETEVTEELNPAGVYSLVSVDGQNVPCTVTHGGHSLDVKSGIFTINADGTCSSEMAFTVPSAGDSSRTVRATYTLEGSTLTMKWEGGGVTTGKVDGDTFMMNNEGMILLYRK